MTQEAHESKYISEYVRKDERTEEIAELRREVAALRREIAELRRRDPAEEALSPGESLIHELAFKISAKNVTFGKRHVVLEVSDASIDTVKLVTLIQAPDGGNVGLAILDAARRAVSIAVHEITYSKILKGLVASRESIVELESTDTGWRVHFSPENPRSR